MNAPAFQAGDRVVIPPYGIGIISGTCARPHSEPHHTHYQVEFKHTSSRAYVPIHTPSATGMRPALNPGDLPDILQALQHGSVDLPRQWSARHQKVTTILASSDPHPLAALIGLLHCWNTRRALPDLDRQAFRKAVKLLEQEVRDLDGQVARTILTFLERALVEPENIN